MTEFDPMLFISVRRRLGIGQREAGELFGGGPNAFTRYETGKHRPPVSVIRLFMMFDKDPSLFERYKQVSQ